MRRLMLVALAAPLLAGCGVGDGVRMEGVTFIDSGQDVADMIGCTDFSGDSEETYVTEGGSCDLDGETVYAYYFEDNDRRDSWVEVASRFGGPYLVGDAWVIDGPPAVLEDLQAEHGGELSGS